MIDFDKVLSRIGEFGIYQWVNVSILCLAVTVMMPFPMFNFIFILYTPPFQCIQAEGYNVSWDGNFTGLCSVPANETDYDQEDVWNRTLKCSKFVYDTTDWEETATTYFDLVCDRSYISATLIPTAIQVVQALGILVFSVIQDRYGRKPGFFIALGVAGVAGVAQVFSPNVWFLLASRIIIGTTVICGWTFPYILALEIVGPSKRTLVTSAMIVCFAAGGGILGLIAYLCNNWVTFGVVTSVSSLVFFLFYGLIDESPRWFLTRGKYSDLRGLVQKIATRNKADVTPRDIRMMLSQTTNQLFSLIMLAQNPAGAVAPKPETPPMVTIIDMCKHFNLFLKLAICGVLYTVNAMVYTGIALNVENLPGNRFLNFSMLALMEIPAGFVIMAIVDRSGRIWTMTIFMLLGGTCALVGSCIDQSMTLVVIILAAFAKFGVSGSFAVLAQICGELFPTPVRGTCQGIVSLVSSLFVAVMPFIIASSKEDKTLPMVIMGVLSLVAGILGLLLPETLHAVLPETIADAKVSPVGLRALKDNLLLKAHRRGGPVAPVAEEDEPLRKEELEMANRNGDKDEADGNAEC